MWHAALVSDVPDLDAALLAEAATKSGLVWLRPAGQTRSWPAWHVWLDGSVLVVGGAGEQQLPALRGPVDVLVRSKESGARLITVSTSASEVTPDDEGWDAAAAALAAGRLNAPVLPAALADRWRGTAVLTRLTPAGPALERPGRYDDASGAAAVEPAPGTTSGWRPWHLGGRRRRRSR